MCVVCSCSCDSCSICCALRSSLNYRVVVGKDRPPPRNLATVAESKLACELVLMRLCWFSFPRYLTMFTPFQIAFLHQWTLDTVQDWWFIFALDRFVDVYFVVDIVRGWTTWFACLPITRVGVETGGHFFACLFFFAVSL